jgi:hypothetical protein
VTAAVSKINLPLILLSPGMRDSEAKLTAGKIIRRGTLRTTRRLICHRFTDWKRLKGFYTELNRRNKSFLIVIIIWIEIIWLKNHLWLSLLRIDLSSDLYLPGLFTMATFKYLFQFETEDQERLFAKCDSPEPIIGTSVTAYPTFEDLAENRNPRTATVGKVWQPHCRRCFQLRFWFYFR